MKMELVPYTGNINRILTIFFRTIISCVDIFIKNRYDALGSFERIQASCTGKGEQYIQAILDDITNFEEDDNLWTTGKNENEFASSSKNLYVNLSCEESVKLIVKAFKAAAEREITVGDGLEVCILQCEQNYDKGSSFFNRQNPIFRDNNTENSETCVNDNNNKDERKSNTETRDEVKDGVKTESESRQSKLNRMKTIKRRKYTTYFSRQFYTLPKH